MWPLSLLEVPSTPMPTFTCNAQHATWDTPQHDHPPCLQYNTLHAPRHHIGAERKRTNMQHDHTLTTSSSEPRFGIYLI